VLPPAPTVGRNRYWLVNSLAVNEVELRVYATRSTSAIVDIENTAAASSFDRHSSSQMPSPVPARGVGIVLEDSTSGLELSEKNPSILCSTNRVICLVSFTVPTDPRL